MEINAYDERHHTGIVKLTDGSYAIIRGRKNETSSALILPAETVLDAILERGDIDLIDTKRFLELKKAEKTHRNKDEEEEDEEYSGGFGLHIDMPGANDPDMFRQD